MRKAELVARLERVRYDAEQKRISAWIDRLAIACNWVAFCGYWCICLPHYFPNEAKFMRCATAPFAKLRALLACR